MKKVLRNFFIFIFAGIYSFADAQSLTDITIPPQTASCFVTLPPDTTLCTGNTVLLYGFAPGAISYLWQDGSTNPTYTATGPGIYWLEINTGTCSARDTINVFYVAPLVVTMSPDDTICPVSGGTIISATGGTSYLWNTGATTSSVNVDPASTTTYTVLVTGNNCSLYDSTTIFVYPYVSTTVLTNHVSCYGAADATVTLIPAGGLPPYNYSWSPAVATGSYATNVPAGGYTVNITDGNNCLFPRTFTITQPPALTLGITGNTTACVGTPALFSAVPAGGISPYSYSWTGGLPAVANQAALLTANSSFICTVTDAHGCTATQNISLTVNPSPVASFTAPGTSCAPLDINFVNSSTGAAQYQWYFGDNTYSTESDPLHSYPSAGNYPISLTAIGSNGCTDTMYVTVSVLQATNALLTSNTTSVPVTDAHVSFNDLSVNSAGCTLYFGDGDSVATCGFTNLQHTYPGVGNYCAQLITVAASGCSDTATICIEVRSDFTFYIPNSFTPNGDGTNDYFSGYGENIGSFEMMIFDGRGKLIYETSDPSRPWDGKTIGGSKCLQNDTYVYSFDIRDVNGNKHHYTGKFNLIR